MEESGLCELWVECDVFGCQCISECDIRQRLYSCNANTQTHIADNVAITTPITECTSDIELRAELDTLGSSSETEAISQMVDTLASERFHQPILDFVKVLKEEESNADFLWNYMEMVSILFYFTKAQRDG